MSFFNSKPWAKIPTDLLENKAMIRAEKELDTELRAAPVLFYLAGATKADDDGIFDIYYPCSDRNCVKKIMGVPHHA